MVLTIVRMQPLGVPAVFNFLFNIPVHSASRTDASGHDAHGPVPGAIFRNALHGEGGTCGLTMCLCTSKLKACRGLLHGISGTACSSTGPGGVSTTSPEMT